MTTGQIQQWAREAGFHKWYSDPYRDYHFGCIQRFAELVRAEALEDAAKVCEAEYDNWDNERPLRICATAIRGLKK